MNGGQTAVRRGALLALALCTNANYNYQIRRNDYFGPAKVACGFFADKISYDLEDFHLFDQVQF